jgi:hypothetical protein
MKIADLTRVVDHLQQLYVAAGAGGPAKDLKRFGDVIRPHANVPVNQFVSSIKRGFANEHAASKSGSRKGTSSTLRKSPPDPKIVIQHVNELRAAGTDPSAFDHALAGLKAAKSLSAAEVAEIARQYADTVTKYKSKALAHADISKAFVRQARFKNKLL